MRAPSRLKSHSGKKEHVVAVSGGFDPLHVGHIRMFKEAAKLGKLIVIVNNDNWLCAKKGFIFMPEAERKELIESLGCVHSVMLTAHAPRDPDRSVCRELRLIKPDIFANGGDRKSVHDIPEALLCKTLCIRMKFNIGEGGKIQSSSWLTNAFLKKNKFAKRTDKR